MDETRNTSSTPQSFAKHAGTFFASFGIRPVATRSEALGFIQAVDQVVDIMQERLLKQGATFSEKAVLDLGSALGEAFRMAFGGTWRYSQAQDRWVIAGTSTKGDEVEFNVFNKLEKRIENGMEDSIQHYFESLGTILK